MKKKVVICLYAPASKGKTSSIRIVHDMLAGSKKKIWESEKKWDFSSIIKLKENTIGCSSLGDPDSDQEERLEELMKDYQCDIIVTASRIKGTTVEIVEKLSAKYGYSIKWISPIYGYEVEQDYILDVFHQTNAEAIINLINKI